MSIDVTEADALTLARTLKDAAAVAVRQFIATAAARTEGGKLIDEHQPYAERVAQLATQARAAEELVAYQGPGYKFK